jgi:hypothetical protein
MPRLQVPRPAELLGPGIDAWVTARPSVLPFINLGAGRYGDILAGLEAQVALLVRQIADEVAQARLASASGGGLTQLAASEFFANRQTGASSAVGRIVLERSAGTLPGGAIPKGFRFSRPALPSNSPPIPAGSYVALRDVSYPQGVSVVSVPIAASSPGATSNAPYYDGDNTAAGAALPTLTDIPFDTNIGVVSWEAAGGSTGESDPDLVAQCEANAVGGSGPTLDAVLAGALSGIGVHRVACFNVAQAYPNPNVSQSIQRGHPAPVWPQPCAYTGVAIADNSFSSGFPGLPVVGAPAGAGVWEGLVGQVIADGFQGVGGQVIVTGINNELVCVAPTVNLRDGDDLKDTSAIDAAILSACRNYFDNRPDWYTWTTRGLRGAISRCHPKILSCSAVTVNDLVTGSALAQPANGGVLATPNGIDVSHFFVVQNGVTTTYQAAA